MAIKGFYGQAVGNSNRLANPDVMVVDGSGKIALLIEIEETQVSPKNVLGDALAILLCNRFAVGRGRQQETFSPTADTKLIIAGYVPSHGQRKQKIQGVIEPRLRTLGGHQDGIRPANVDLLFEGDIEQCMEQLQQKVSGILSLR